METTQEISKTLERIARALEIIAYHIANKPTDWIWKNIEPMGVICVIKADHFCAKLQGDKGEFTTSAFRGNFENATTRMEFLELMK